MAFKKKIRVRFPPSPTGELHLGSARTALYNYLFAKKPGGQLIFRIEDTDQDRYVPGTIDRFIEDLKWLGLTWDEGPDIGGPHAPYMQSARLDLYQKAAAELVRAGRAYRCDCTPERLESMRQAQKARKEAPKYDRQCFGDRRSPACRRGREIGDRIEPHVVRFLIPEGKTTFTDLVRGEVTVVNETLDDFVLLKSDGFPTYHLANVVDDHAMAITYVIRGEEWLPSTPKHLLLYQALGWPPPEFAHLPLILASDKKKLSKRLHGEAVWVATYRREGYLPEALVNYLALLGWNPGSDEEFFTLKELVQEFSLERIHKAGAIFDPEKLRSFNAHYLRRLKPDEILDQLRAGDFLGPTLTDLPDKQLVKWIVVHRDRITTLGDFRPLVESLVELGDYAAELLIFKKSDRDRAGRGLAAAVQALESATPQTWELVEPLQNVLSTAVGDGLANGDVFWPVRVALSGQAASAAPTELLWVLGKEESLCRLKKARALLGG